MSDAIKLKVQFGHIVINPITGIPEHFDYPEGASELEIMTIRAKADLRQAEIWRQYNREVGLSEYFPQEGI